MNENSNSICKCNHPQIDHRYLYKDIYGFDGIMTRQVFGTTCIRTCICKQYIQDNLKYLEQLYESRNH